MSVKILFLAVGAAHRARGGRSWWPSELQPPFAPSLLTLYSSSCLDLLLATCLECIRLKTMTYQTCLKNLKKLKKTWTLRRNTLVAEANSTTAFWINCPLFSRASFTIWTKSFCFNLQPQQFSFSLDFALPYSTKGTRS